MSFSSGIGVANQPRGRRAASVRLRQTRSLPTRWCGARSISSHPGPRGFRLALVAVDLVLLDHGQADIVEAVEQAVLAEGIDLERPRIFCFPL